MSPFVARSREYVSELRIAGRALIVEQSQGVPFLRAEFAWKHSHKLKFLHFGFGESLAEVFSVKFSGKDRSVYVMPAVVGSGSMFYRRNAAWHEVPLRGGSAVHLSLHDSGIVNLAAGARQDRIRRDTVLREPAQCVLTMRVNSVDDCKKHALEFFNTPKAGCQHLPFSGFPHLPLMLSVYCVAKEHAWDVPVHGDTMMLHFCAKIVDRPYDFHIIEWQNSRMSRGAGAVELVFGPVA